MAPSTQEVSSDDDFDTYLLLSNNSSDVLQVWDEHKSQLPMPLVGPGL